MAVCLNGYSEDLIFLDCVLDVLEVCDNERDVLRRVWLEICRETYLKG